MSQYSGTVEMKVDIDGEIDDIEVDIEFDYSISGKWSRGSFDPISGYAEPPESPDLNISDFKIICNDPRVVEAFKKQKPGITVKDTGINISIKDSINVEEMEEEISVDDGYKFRIEDDCVIFS